MFTVCLNSGGRIVVFGIRGHWEALQEMNSTTERRGKKALLIVNPCAGKNRTRANLSEIVDAFPDGAFDFTIKYTTCQGDAINIARNFAREHDLVICCGGDGTLNETINGLMSAGVSVPIGYLPMGSTNDLAATLGIPTKLKEAAELIASGHTNGYDVGDCNGHQFSYVACFGPGTKISYSTPQKMKNLLGYNAYMINGFFLHLIPALADVKPRHIKIEYDGNVLEDDFYFGSFSNSTSVAGLFKFDKNDIKLDDGKFELLLVRKLSSPLAAFGMLHRIMKRDFDGDSLIFIKASEVKFTFEKPEEWTLDGECGGSTTQVDLKVLNRAVSIFSPENPMFSSKEEKEEATV